MGLTLFGYSHGEDLVPIVRALEKSWCPLIESIVLCCTDELIGWPQTNLPSEFHGQPIKFISYPPLTGYGGYSKYCLEKFWEHFQSSHVMTVHTDGYVLDWDKWDHAFLLYDYIGAPWGINCGHCPPKHRVGNGGFSIRSRRLMEKVSEIYKQELPSYVNEDLFICVQHRDRLEQLGFKFAPIDVAARFSIEAPLHDFPSGAGCSFGFHGRIQQWTRDLEIK